MMEAEEGVEEDLQMPPEEPDTLAEKVGQQDLPLHQCLSGMQLLQGHALIFQEHGAWVMFLMPTRSIMPTRFNAEGPCDRRS
jgi:hypothetical protein